MNNNYFPFFNYKDQGLYYNQVRAYIKEFTEVHILLFDEFICNPKSTLKGVFEFLNVDASFVPDTSEKHYVTRIPKSRLINNIIH